MTGSMNLTELVTAANAGDQNAWNRLVERYVPLVMSVARRYRLCSEDAADVNQTVWLRLVEHLDQIRGPRARLAGSSRPRRTRRCGCSRPATAPCPVDPQTGFAFDTDAGGKELDEDLLRDERRQALREALGEIRPHHRELLLLLMAEPPLSYDDISQRLGMPKGSIGPTRARCLAELRHTSALRSFLTTNDSVFGR